MKSDSDSPSQKARKKIKKVKKRVVNHVWICYYIQALKLMISYGVVLKRLKRCPC